jgi:hypothetical protein
MQIGMERPLATADNGASGIASESLLSPAEIPATVTVKARQTPTQKFELFGVDTIPAVEQPISTADGISIQDMDRVSASNQCLETVCVQMPILNCYIVAWSFAMYPHLLFYIESVHW